MKVLVLQLRQAMAGTAAEVQLSTLQCSVAICELGTHCIHMLLSIIQRLHVHIHTHDTVSHSVHRIDSGKGVAPSIQSWLGCIRATVSATG